MPIGKYFSSTYYFTAPQFDQEQAEYACKLASLIRTSCQQQDALNLRDDDGDLVPPRRARATNITYERKLLEPPLLISD